MPREKQYASYQSLAPKEQTTSSFTCMEIQNLNHRKKILSENTIVCIDLFANWCAPCKVVSPQFAELAERYNNPGSCLLVKEDVDLELTRDYNISGIPAFIFYRQGQLLRNQADNSPVAVVGGNIKNVQTILDKLLTQ